MSGTDSVSASPTVIRRARRIHRALGRAYPQAHQLLHFSTPLQLAVVTILAARSTDAKINELSPALFKRYPDAAAFAAAEREELEGLIHASGFFRAKARTLITLGQQLVERFDGEVPANLESLISLPGLGRKTANVVLGNAFGISAIAVDTHVLRLAQRLGWSSSESPERVEADLAAVFLRADWTQMSLRVTWHGRAACHARRPACGACPVADLCPSAGIGEGDPVKARKLIKEPA